MQQGSVPNWVSSTELPEDIHSIQLTKTIEEYVLWKPRVGHADMRKNHTVGKQPRINQIQWRRKLEEPRSQTPELYMSH